MAEAGSNVSADPSQGSQAMPIALPRWQRLAIYTAVGALLATGIAWLIVAWPFGNGADDMTTAMRAAAAWSLRLHGIAAYAGLIVVGAVLPVHIRLAWLRQRNRASGCSLTILFLALAITGLWLYYGSEGGRSVVSTVHWLIGLAWPIWLIVHRTLGHASRSKRH